MAGDVVTPCYSYTPDYIWDFEIPPTIINVTYDLYEDGTKVSSTTVKQEANSAVNFPKSMTSASHNGLWHELFYYDYTVEGTVGDEDCTIIVTRTVKAGTVHALEGLSNNKAYNIGCKRGAFLTADGYMISTDLNATANAAGPGQFAVITYEGSYYLYSVDEGKIVKNNGALVSNLITEGFSADDALKIEAKTDPYFLFYFTIDGTNNGLNTNGNQPLGYVINSWSQADEGNQYYMVEAGDFDPTAALAELDAYFNPAYFVTYVVKDEFGNTIFTSDSQPAKAGAKITTLLDEFKKPFYTYSDNNVEITEQNTTVEFTATWNGPFKLSADFDNAQWQNMAMRGTWYVTSGVKDGDGAYQTQNANTMGLVEDAYQWAFIGNGYDGFKIINKAEGNGKSFGWTDAQQTNAGIPTIMDDNKGYHVWKIVPSTNTSVPAGSFCLNVPSTSLYVNQYGGAGGAMKFWDSSSNVVDAGSAFTVFDVPTNFASFVADEISPYFESTAKYFVFTDAAKAEIGYDETYKINCSYVTYKSMKETLQTKLLVPESFIYPSTGYYRIQSNYYPGRYMSYMNFNGNPCLGTTEDATTATSVVKLTALDNHKYTITVGGLNVTAPAMNAKVDLANEGAEFTAVVTAPGVGVFTTGTTNGALHCAATQDYYCVGWTDSAEASQWSVEDVAIIVIADNKTREYGEENPELTYSSEGVDLEGVPSLSCEATATSPVGEYPIVITKGSVTNDNDSYVNGTLTITKVTLTVGLAEMYTSEEGEAIPEFALAYSGWKLGETEEVLTELPVATTTATVESRAGTYPIIISGGSAENYELNYIPGTLTITALPPTSFGDVNRDERVSVGDIVKTANYILGKTPMQPFNVRLADANNDGDVDAADLVEEVNLITKSFVDASSAVKWQWVDNNEQLTGYMYDGGIRIQLESATPYTAFQMTLTLPEGSDMDDVKAKLLRTSNHQLGIGKLNEHQLRIIGYSLDNLPFTGQTGTLLEVKGLEGDILIDDILFVSPTGQKRRFAPISISPATGIFESDAETVNGNSVNGKCFDLTGRPMPRMITKSGLYINNGKKMMIR